MNRGNHLAGIVAALLVTMGTHHTAHAKPLRISYGTWVGYGPLFVAQEMGLFAAEGVEVDLLDFEEGASAVLFDRQIDAYSSTIDSAVARFDPDEEALVCVLAMDESLGGDGIVATNDIQSIADLKGRSVAFNDRSAGHFYLSVLLHEAGLTEADVEAVDLPNSDLVEAFLLQEVDAVVTWEPNLTQGKHAEHGHLLTDSSKHPGLLVDCLISIADVFEARKAEFRALARAWDAAVAYVEAHPEEANEIMARHVGGWLEDPAVFAETLKGVRLYDGERNRAYFGTPENPGQICDTAQKAIDFWSKAGLLEADLAPADVIAHGIWD